MLHRLAELDRAVRDGYAAYDFQRVFQTLFQFCTLDLSALLLRHPQGRALLRRRRQPAPPRLPHRARPRLPPAGHLARADARLHHGGGLARPASRARTPRSTSRTSRRPRPSWLDPALAAKWETIRRVRRVVTGALEVERQDKRIGASLEAAPVVHVADPATRAALASVDFADLCITSDLTLSADAGARRRLQPRRRPRRRRRPAARDRRRSAPAAGRSCPTSAPTPTRASAPAATPRSVDPEAASPRARAHGIYRVERPAFSRIRPERDGRVVACCSVSSSPLVSMTSQDRKADAR